MGLLIPAYILMDKASRALGTDIFLHRLDVWSKVTSSDLVPFAPPSELLNRHKGMNTYECLLYSFAVNAQLRSMTGREVRLSVILNRNRYYGAAARAEFGRDYGRMYPNYNRLAEILLWLHSRGFVDRLEGSPPSAGHAQGFGTTYWPKREFQSALLSANLAVESVEGRAGSVSLKSIIEEIVPDPSRPGNTILTRRKVTKAVPTSDGEILDRHTLNLGRINDHTRTFTVTYTPHITHSTHLPTTTVINRPSPLPISNTPTFHRGTAEREAPGQNRKVRLSSSHLTYQRIFEDSVRVNGAGRFYAPFQYLIGSRDRESIQLNGSDTVELDYSSYALRILYHHCGIDIDSRNHEIGANDLYNLPILQDDFYRPFRKKVVNVVINCESRRKAINAIREEKLSFIATFTQRNPLFRMRDSSGFNRLWLSTRQTPISNILPASDPRIVGLLETDPEAILDAILSTHSELENRFLLRNDTWKLIQWKDSQIAEGILLKFVDAGKPILGIHDSFIVLVEDKQFLLDSMISEYQRVLESELIPAIKEKSVSDADLSFESVS